MRTRPTMTPPKGSAVARLSRHSITPALRESVVLIRQTMLPPERNSRRRRMAAAAGTFAAIAGGAYAVTGSAMWVFLVMIVGVPIVALPSFILVGMALQMREARSGRTLKHKHTTT